MWRRMAHDARHRIAQIWWIYVATTTTITTAATDRLSCVFIVYPSGTNEVQPVCLQQSGEASPPLSLALILSGCLPPWMTMSMTNHGQHVKNLSWNIWAVNLEEQFLFPKLNSFLKLVHKYCYKCVESKQLETNERSTAFPGTAYSLSLLPFGSTSSGWLQFMNHLKDEGPHSIEPNTYHLNTQIQLEHASGTYDNISTWATWQI